MGCKSLAMHIMNEETNGALMCGRMHFKETELTQSVNGYAQGSLLQTIIDFTEYFGLQNEQGLTFKKLELFLCEKDMHTGAKPFQTTTFE